MTRHQLKAARLSLGLSIDQICSVMETDPRSWRRFEKGDRLPAGRVVRLMSAYLSGYRPNDWPLDNGD